MLLRKCDFAGIHIADAKHPPDPRKICLLVENISVHISEKALPSTFKQASVYGRSIFQLHVHESGVSNDTNQQELSLFGEE